LKGFLKNNFYIFFIYALLIAISASFLVQYKKEDIHVYLNQYVGEPLTDRFFYYITYLGDGTVAVFILLAILIRNVRMGLYATASFLTASLFSISLKRLFFDEVNRPSFIFKYYDERPITYVEGVNLYIHNSFPSGHSTQAFSIFMCLVFLSKHPAYKLLFFSLAVLTASSRVYLSQHWLSDITAGSLIGVFFSIFYYVIFIQGNRLEQLNRPLFSFYKKA
jgi:membrane-associated phospholipid phosphatase